MASLLDLDIDPSCTLTQVFSLDSFQQNPVFSIKTDKMIEKTYSPSQEGNNPTQSRFGTACKIEPSNPPNMPWRQPAVSAYIPDRTPFPNGFTGIGRAASGPYTPPSNSTGSVMSPPSTESNYSSTRGPPVNCTIDGSIIIKAKELETCYAYAIHRGNGLYTRLIAADRLPPMRGLAQTQDPEGLIILPMPRGSSPAERCGVVPDVSVLCPEQNFTSISSSNYRHSDV